MSADSIEDPNLRAEYEAALKEYWEKMRQHSKQYGLRRIKESDLPIVQRHILGLYSGPAFDSKNLETEALKLDISKYVKDDKIRITMLEGMKNRIIENAKPPGKVYIIPDERKIRGWPTDK